MQGRAYTDGPWKLSWKRVREGWDQFTGDLSGLKSYFRGEPSNERVRAQGQRVALMASVWPVSLTSYPTRPQIN